MKKIYLAGPEVFLPNAKEKAENLKKMCENLGFKPLFPLDNEIHEKTKKDLSRAIFKANVAMIQEADYIIANLNPFRGSEPDSGTVWEVGFAVGLHKKVLGYTATKEYKDNVKSKNGFDTNGYEVEDFGNPLNLMISESIILCKSFKHCLNEIFRIENLPNS